MSGPGSGIMFCLVSRGTTILAKYSTIAGNVSEVCDVLLAKISPSDERMSLVAGEYNCHYVNDSGIITMAIADPTFDRAVMFEFLEKVSNSFKIQYGSRANSAIAYAMNAEFCLVIANEMKRYNDPVKIDVLQNEVKQVKGIMSKNIEELVNRGERLDLLVEKTENLDTNSVTFRTRSRSLQRAMW